MQNLDLDNQQLSLAGNDLSISKGNVLTLPFSNYLPLMGGVLTGTTSLIGANFGVGINIPLQLIHLSSSTQSSIIRIDNTVNTLSSALQCYNSDLDLTLFITRGRNSGSNFGNILGNGASEMTSTSSVGLIFGTRTNTPVVLGSNNVEVVRIINGTVSIGNTFPNSSSVLDITSTTKGVLFPRLTTAQINAILTPADGLTVYNTDLKTICFYDISAALWRKVSHLNM